jgi:dihydroneopterin aldolase
MDKILLKGLRFHGYHGVAEEERRMGQKYEVDAELICDLSAAGQTDDFLQTIDYAAVVRLIIEIGTQKSFQLFEALAEAIAHSILDRFPVKEVRIVVKKLSPPIAQTLAYAGVEIHRKRDG